MLMNKDSSSVNHFNKIDIFICFFILFSILIVYWQVKDFVFIKGFDDDFYVTGNLSVCKGITEDSIKQAFKFTDKSDRIYWHPITLLSHMFDVSLFELNPAGHHLMSVFFHAINSLLLYLFLRKFSGCRWKSAFVAILFAIHPLNVDSVAWISERKSVLSTSFWFLGILLYGYYVENPSKIKYLLVITCMFLGLLAKPLLVTMPFVLLLIDFWPLRRIKLNSSFSYHKLRPLFIEKIPLFFLSGIWVYLSSLSMRRLDIVIETYDVGLGLRLANAVVSYIKYFFHVVWPFNLAVFYPYPEKMLPFGQTGSALLILIIVTLIVVTSVRQRPWLFVGWFWFIGTLVPAIGIVQNGLWPALADRWMYIPIIGILIIISWGIPELLTKLKRKNTVIIIILSFLFSIVALISWMQTSYWSNCETLFSHSLDVTPGDIFMRQNLGTTLLEAGKTDEAIVHFKKIVDAKPEFLLSQFTLAKCYLKQEKTDEAIALTKKALTKEPDSERGLILLGRSYYKKGNIEKAIEQFKKMLKIDPDSADSHIQLALVMENKGDISKAVEHYNNAIKLNNRLYKVYNNLGLIFAGTSEKSKAISYFKKAIEINDFFAEAHNNLAALYEQMGKLNKAEIQYRKAISADTNYAQAYNNLGSLLLRKGNALDEATNKLMEALHINPDYAEAYNNLGLAFESQKNVRKAMECYFKALKIKPDNVEAHNNLGVLLFHEKNYKKAIYHFRKALVIDPTRHDINYNLNKVISIIGANKD